MTFKIRVMLQKIPGTIFTSHSKITNYETRLKPLHSFPDPVTCLMFARYFANAVRHRILAVEVINTRHTGVSDKSHDQMLSRITSFAWLVWLVLVYKFYQVISISTVRHCLLHGCYRLQWQFLFYVVVMDTRRMRTSWMLQVIIRGKCLLGLCQPFEHLRHPLLHCVNKLNHCFVSLIFIWCIMCFSSSKDFSSAGNRNYNVTLTPCKANATCCCPVCGIYVTISR